MEICNEEMLKYIIVMQGSRLLKLKLQRCRLHATATCIKQQQRRPNHANGDERLSEASDQPFVARVVLKEIPEVNSRMRRAVHGNAG